MELEDIRIDIQSYYVYAFILPIEVEIDGECPDELRSELCLVKVGVTGNIGERLAEHRNVWRRILGIENNNIRPKFPHRLTNNGNDAEDIERNIHNGHRNLALLLPCDPGDCDRQRKEKEEFVLSLFGLPAKRTRIRRIADFVNTNLANRVTPTEIVVTTKSQFRRMRKRYLASIDGGNPLTLSDVANTLAPVRSVTKYLHDPPLRLSAPSDPRIPRLEIDRRASFR